MKVLGLIFMFLIAGFSFGQTRKIFIDNAGKYIANSKGAVAYLLITKLDEDSAYMVKRFDILDTIVFSGTFKDESLTTPIGKFVYYDKNRRAKDRKSSFTVYFDATLDEPPADTNNFVREVGYYQNGKKEGLWVKYAARGIKASEIMYQNGKGNWQYKIYADNNKGWMEGTLIDNLMEGKFYKYNGDSVLVSEMDMKHGRMTDEIVHFQNAKENPDMDKYLENKLNKYHDLIIRNLAVVKYTVDMTGRIINLQIKKGITPEFNSDLIAALSSAPNYTPATDDGAPVSQNIEKSLALFEYYGDKNMAIRAAKKKIAVGFKTCKAIALLFRRIIQGYKIYHLLTNKPLFFPYFCIPICNNTCLNR